MHGVCMVVVWSESLLCTSQKPMSVECSEEEFLMSQLLVSCYLMTSVMKMADVGLGRPSAAPLLLQVLTRHCREGPAG